MKKSKNKKPDDHLYSVDVTMTFRVTVAATSEQEARNIANSIDPKLIVKKDVRAADRSACVGFSVDADSPAARHPMITRKDLGLGDTVFNCAMTEWDRKTLDKNKGEDK